MKPPGLLYRLVWLNTGLVGFGVGLGLLVRARLGLDPWDVLSQGLSRHLGLQIGWVVDVLGAVVLLAWIPLRQRPGLGTLLNIVVVGLAANATLDLVPFVPGLAWRVALMVSAVLLVAVATGGYIGAGLGPGPRDGLMTGIAARGHSIRVVRFSLEVSVLVIGYLLGGSVGVGTVVYAVCIGPLVHLTLPRLALPGPSRTL
ncbi:MAG: putative rane protein [Acidimicrobiaceae bacterium]|nr:putative rane protein [Acidimicrobiaceae bacterium]